MYHEAIAELERLGSPRIVVVGDLILDRYTWGNTERVSPEAPVLVLNADQEEVRLGGAASVAGLLRALDVDAALAGVVGDDAAGRVARKLLDEAAIDSTAVVTDPQRPTTTKERFIGRAAGRHAHQILRVDREVCESISGRHEQELRDRIGQLLEGCNAILISDYAKGVCTATLIQHAIGAARRQEIPVVVDPGRGVPCERYRGATVFIPNRCEMESITGERIGIPSDALALAQSLRKQAAFEAVIVKLDRDGMAVSSSEGVEDVFPTQSRAVYDITGAGDMVLAIVGLCQAGGLSPATTVHLANTAAGLEVERLGVAPVTREEIRACLVGRSGAAGEKLVTLEVMEKLSADYRRQGTRTVFTNGCFDLLHVGHVSYLQEAAALGDVLIVAINSDESVRRLKGPERPVIGESDRAALLAALSCIDHVLVFHEDTPHELLRRIRPDVLVKGGTYSVEQVVGHEIVRSYGGTVAVTHRKEGISTSKLISSVREKRHAGYSV